MYHSMHVMHVDLQTKCKHIQEEIQFENSVRLVYGNVFKTQKIRCNEKHSFL